MTHNELDLQGEIVHSALDYEGKGFHTYDVTLGSVPHAGKKPDEEGEVALSIIHFGDGEVKPAAERYPIGKQMRAKGRASSRSYFDKNGDQRYFTSIKVSGDKVRFAPEAEAQVQETERTEAKW